MLKSILISGREANWFREIHRMLYTLDLDRLNSASRTINEVRMYLDRDGVEVNSYSIDNSLHLIPWRGVHQNFNSAESLSIFGV